MWQDRTTFLFFHYEWEGPHGDVESWLKQWLRAVRYWDVECWPKIRMTKLQNCKGPCRENQPGHAEGRVKIVLDVNIVRARYKATVSVEDGQWRCCSTVQRVFRKWLDVIEESVGRTLLPSDD